MSNINNFIIKYEYFHTLIQQICIQCTLSYKPWYIKVQCKTLLLDLLQIPIIFPNVRARTSTNRIHFFQIDAILFRWSKRTGDQKITSPPESWKGGGGGWMGGGGGGVCKAICKSLTQISKLTHRIKMIPHLEHGCF